MRIIKVLATLKSQLERRISYYIEGLFATSYLEYLHLKGVTARSSLDIGAATGVFVARLQTLGVDAHGVEANRRSVEAAVTSNIVCSRFTPMTRASRRFDLVTLTQVIYFIGPAPSVLAQMRDFLEPSGYLFIVTSEKGTAAHHKKYPNHHFYDRDEYCAFAERLGYRLIDFTNYESRIGMAFNSGMFLGLARLGGYMLNISKANYPSLSGNHAYVLLQRIQ